jgi:hypothetical protein
MPQSAAALPIAPEDLATLRGWSAATHAPVDEKSQIQALERTQPVRPVRPGRPERRTHDYLGHGTTTLFAVLEVATGRVTDACQPRHRHREFLAFLKLVAKAYPRRQLHVVVDNYATHKHQRVQAPAGPGLASQASPRAAALHPDLRLLAQPGRGVLRDHRTPGAPPRRLRQRRRTGGRDWSLLRRLESALPAVSLDKDADQILAKLKPPTATTARRAP